MTLERAKEVFEDYRKAAERLREALDEDPSKGSIIVDGTIKRFEFTFELAWKLAKAILDYNNIDARGPRLIIKETFRFGLIKAGQSWIEMLEDRNKTSHIYDEKQALAIYNRIKSDHCELLEKFINETADYINSVEK